MERSDKVVIKKLLRARDVFARFSSRLNDDQDKAGAIQAFEFCYELAWKMIKKVLEVKGVLVLPSPRESFRAAAQNDLIEDPEVWFDFIKARNKAAHIYDEEMIDEIVQIFPFFLNNLDKLIEKLLKDENVAS